LQHVEKYLVNVMWLLQCRAQAWSCWWWMGRWRTDWAWYGS